MKRILFFVASYCLCFLFSCKKDALVTGTTVGHSASSFSSALNARTLSTVVDNTYTLQTQLDAGNVTLTAGAVYNVTGLVVTHALNLNGSTINMIGTSGAAIKLMASGASITNGLVVGNWLNTTAGNPTGVIGIRILADNCTISGVTVSSVSSYGILVGAYNNPHVTYCTISNTGYIGFYFDAETAITSGGVFSNNTVDRSMLPISVMGLAVGIRGSTNNAAVPTSNWTISGNTIKMPYLPTNWGSECIETRYCNASSITQNILVGGSIGVSVVRSTGVTVASNNFTQAQLEALEFADSQNSVSQNNIISSSAGAGTLLDGANGCSGITLTGDKISGTANECVHAYYNTKNVTISSCTLTATTGNRAINLQQTSGVQITGTAFIGNNQGTSPVMLDNCAGNLSISGGSISNFTTSVVAVYNCTAGLVTNNVTMSAVTVSGVPRALSSYVTNGGSLGSNIVLYN